mgnify:CR=1 FL=1
MNEVDLDIIEWAAERGIFENASPTAQAMKTIEEAEELFKANTMDDYEEIVDAIGDIYVTLVIQAHMHNLTVRECAEHAYEVIKNRKGKMVDGQFVKEVA